LHHPDQATAGEIAAAAPRLTYKGNPTDPSRLGGVRVHSFLLSDTDKFCSNQLGFIFKKNN
jgi:hypothetical protein